MRVVGHIVWKDLVRLKWILVLWACVLAAGLALAVIQSGLNPDTYFPFWIAANIVTIGFLPLLAFGLVMGLMHDDPVAEIDAFWITRPISGGELLAAKALGLLLLALIPVLVALPFWLAQDYGGDQVLQAAGQVLQRHFVIVAAALPFAALSASSSRFVMNVMIGAGSLLLLVLLLGLGESRTAVRPAAGLVQTKAWLLAWLWLATAVGVALNQFLRRGTRQSLAAVAGAVVLACVVAKAWTRPLDFSRAPADPVAGQAGDARVFSAALDGASRQVRVVAEVPLHDGAGRVRRGAGLKVQNVFLDFTGELQVAFSETSPRLDGRLTDRLPGAVPPAGPHEYFFLTNPGDQRLLPVTPVQRSSNLEVATLRFLHWTISVRPAAWQGGAPANLRTWLMDAVLTKVAADPS